MTQQHVGRRERLAEVIDEIARAREAVRLEREHDAPAGVALAHRLQRRAHLGRVMAVVIDDADPPERGHDVADVLQAPVDALEGGERAHDRRVLDAELARHRDGGEGIAHVVQCPAGSP